MHLLAILAGASSLFGAPADHEALSAIQRRFDHAAGGSLAAFEPAAPGSRLDYPAAVSVLRCDVRSANLGGMSGATDRVQVCVVEIMPYGAPAYTVRGAFRHDGLEWSYYGPLGEREIGYSTYGSRALYGD